MASDQLTTDETNANQLKVLVYKRGQCKAKLTRFQSYIQSQSSTVSELRLRLARLEHVYNEFETIQSQIELVNMDDIMQTEERDSFESLFYSLSAQAEDAIQCQTSQVQTAVNNSPTHNNSTHSTSSQVQVKLPSIDLPSFNGKYEDWLPFSETFNALIHENESLNLVQKFHYLRSAIKGEAAQVIQSLELISSNYAVAWSLLEKRYKNNRVIIQNHVRALFELPVVEREVASSLRSLLDGVLRHVRALKALDQPTDTWGTLLLHIVSSKLCYKLQQEWELSTESDKLPTFDQLTDFLQRRCQMLETTQSKTQKQISSNSSSELKARQKSCLLIQSHNCRLCNGKHPIYYCQDLLKLPHSERYQKLSKAGICFNCLKPGHKVSECGSSKGCKLCSKKHNTILHSNTKSNPPSSNKTSHDSSSKTNDHALVSTHTTSIRNTSSRIILSTAVVVLISPNGKKIQCRALLDNGSQSCFLTENICQQLGLSRTNNTHQVVGLNSSPIHTRGVTCATVKSCVSSYKVDLSFVVVPRITEDLPREHVNMDHFRIPNHINLADPHFEKPGKIDMLLGQEIYLEILCIGQLKTQGLPILQKTRLGWIVGGKMEDSTHQPTQNQETCLFTTTQQISTQLQGFWALEEATTKVHLTSEEKRCEEHFMENTYRELDGRYTVSIPFHKDPQELGESKEIAFKRFKQLERKFSHDPKVHKEYCSFINEYKQLNHMELVDEEVQPTKDYFLPHHAVIKPSSLTTKLRVVFDASAITTSGLSLNDIMMVGPTVQSDIVSIFLRFRTHNIVLTADIEKMYRQVNINPSQRDLLKILWRESPTEPLQTYRLNTVTYGTASAPYLATRTLIQLAEDEEINHPNASTIVKRDFYVDDLLTGTDNEETALELKRELTDLLSKGKFNLRKWNSNSQNLKEQLSSEQFGQSNQSLPSTTDLTVKTLGLWWSSEQDQFHFKHKHRVELRNKNQLTKRIVLAEIASLFDPLGLVAPVIVRAKMYLQELWKLNLSWDESLPIHLSTQWIKLSECLNDLNHVVIDRQVTLSDPTLPFELHGFADASEKAYGGAVYLRHDDTKGNIKVSLLCAKSRVAPLKTVSLPRLELCAALLLSELMQRVADALNVPTHHTTYWTDSTVVLAWLRSEPARWTTFVANRVSKIQDLTKNGKWNHVSTEVNPADIISRGSQAQLLTQSQLWWHGPSWLADDKRQWPSEYNIENIIEVPEERKNITTTLTTTTRKENDTIQNLIEKYSSFTKLVRITSQCLRFINNTKQGHEKKTGPLDTTELNVANIIILKFVQSESFSQDIKRLKINETPLSKELHRLSPFLDKAGLIRVGGRLEASKLDYDAKHPILLPKNSKITEMIIREEHLRNLHCGPQALLYIVRQQYWPLSGRNLVRKITFLCIKCFKAKPKDTSQLMGDLPVSRVTPARCFLHTGVDYCGPFHIRPSKRRGTRTVKSYVCVFVCLATKAVHLELVTDLTTDTFLGALRRFISRRGICVDILSDNGRTFVGANRELKELQKFLKIEASTIIDAATMEGIRWKFNPPYSPHMGGLWEAAVKSLKYHLKRVIGNASLTYEEFNTVLTQVEAVLNSRPLTPMSNDPSDISVLTPAHFLTQSSLTAIPEPSVRLLPENRLSRWQRVQQLLQHFWMRWSREYLNNLQHRGKWKTKRPDIQVGTLVLLKDDNLPPLSWPIGRVVKLHPGRDNSVRVVSLKTSSGVVSRAINKLCPLPL